ncbi:hypothetical protein [Nonomuraea sp. NPDC049480]|uniref:hypothetical protein n=1 Tax=Nonomuraea sp. NPDC049480 TaxID=3364353 RepID=UPI0037B9C045
MSDLDSWMPRAVNAADLLRGFEAEARARRRWHRGAISDTRWNGWRLKPSTYVLELVRDGNFVYEVDLDRCLDSAETLDWIMQVSGKEFYRLDMGAVISGLIYAIDDVIDPQRRMCSFGSSTRLTQKEVRAAVREYVKNFGKRKES